VTAKRRRALFRCGRCGKSYSSPLGHQCTVRTDFKRRTAAAKKEAAAAKRRGDRHAYSACADDGCHRLACVAYKAGVLDGYDDGYDDGKAACPRPHK
jgi:hypothetical protein